MGSVVRLIILVVGRVYVLGMFSHLEDAYSPHCDHTYYHNGYDGLGHQLHGVFSCMVYSRIVPGACYVKRPDMTHGFDHGCKGCNKLYAALHSGWAAAPPGTKAKGVDNCWLMVQQSCYESTDQNVRVNATCNAARLKLSREWVVLVDAFAKARGPGPRTVDVAVHVRKGDLPRETATDYAAVLEKIAHGEAIDFFVEFKGDSKAIQAQLCANHVCHEHDNKDISTVDAWLAMRGARHALLVHDSSFSVSAHLARHGLTVAQYRRPQGGRYDGNTFECRLRNTSWWWTYEHGSSDCNPPAAWFDPREFHATADELDLTLRVNSKHLAVQDALQARHGIHFALRGGLRHAKAADVETMHNVLGFISFGRCCTSWARL